MAVAPTSRRSVDAAGNPVGPTAPLVPLISQQTVGTSSGAGSGAMGTLPGGNGTTYNANIGAAPTYQKSTVGYVPGQTFTTGAPSPMGYGDFSAPDPSQLANDPYYQFRTQQGQQGIERSAAARGTLLSGGLLKSLERYRQGLASEEANNVFNRALGVYTTNRDTNAQNYGQRHTSFQDELDAFRANTDAAQGWKRLDGSTANSNQGAINVNESQLRDQMQRGGVSASDIQQQIDDAYARQVAATRAQNEQTAAMMGTIPTGKPARVWR